MLEKNLSQTSLNCILDRPFWSLAPGTLLKTMAIPLSGVSRYSVNRQGFMMSLTPRFLCVPCSCDIYACLHYMHVGCLCNASCIVGLRQKSCIAHCFQSCTLCGFREKKKNHTRCSNLFFGSNAAIIVNVSTSGRHYNAELQSSCVPDGQTCSSHSAIL